MSSSLIQRSLCEETKRYLESSIARIVKSQVSSTMLGWAIPVLTVLRYVGAPQPPLSFQAFPQAFQQQFQTQQPLEVQQVPQIQCQQCQAVQVPPPCPPRPQIQVPPPECPEEFSAPLPLPSEEPAPPPPPIQEQENILERLYEMGQPSEPPPFDVNNLNTVMNRVGRELHFLSEKSRDCLNEKIRGLSQLKRLREGLKNAYKDIYGLQGTLAAYQNALKNMQEYLRAHKGKIVVVDNRQLGEMYSMVRRLQTAAESIVSGAMCTQKKPCT